MTAAPRRTTAIAAVRRATAAAALTALDRNPAEPIVVVDAPAVPELLHADNPPRWIVLNHPAGPLGALDDPALQYLCVLDAPLPPSLDDEDPATQVGLIRTETMNQRFFERWSQSEVDVAFAELRGDEVIARDRNDLHQRFGGEVANEPLPAAPAFAALPPRSPSSAIRISVVTPVLNQVELIRQTMESVLTQPGVDLEYIVVDGGSTDGTAEIISEYEPHLASWVSEPDDGHSDAVNKGFRRASGDVLAWLNGGDLYHAGALQRIVGFFAERPEVHWVQTQPAVIDGNGTVVSIAPTGPAPILCDYLSFEDPDEDLRHIQQESTFWSAELWKAAGATLAEDLRLANDFELWTRFFQRAPLHNVAGLTGSFRIHDGQRSRAQRAAYNAEVNAVRDRCLDQLGCTAEELRENAAHVGRIRPWIYDFDAKAHQQAAPTTDSNLLTVPWLTAEATRLRVVANRRSTRIDQLRERVEDQRAQTNRLRDTNARLRQKLRTQQRSSDGP